MSITVPRLIAAYAAGIAAATLIGIPAAGHSAPAPAMPQIEEDDPRWDCRTMGNRVCGEDDIVYQARYTGIVTL